MVSALFYNSLRYLKQAFAGLPYVTSLRPATLRKVFSLMERREQAAVIILLGVALASGSTSFNRWYHNHTVAIAAAGGEYAEGIIGQPRLINPLLATSDTDTALLRLVFSGLYKYDGEGNLIPDLAEGQPELSDDRKTYTVHLRRAVKWHNNRDFTADDVVFTIQTLQNPSYKSPARADWLNTTVTKVDDFTVTFTVKDVSGPFINNLALPILSSSEWGRVDADDFVLSQNNLEAIGTGPYFIKEIKKLPQGTVQSIKLEAFASYYNGRPHLDTIQLVFFETYEEILHGLHGKQIDGFGFVPFDKDLYLDKDNESLTIRQLALPQYQAAFFNLSNKMFADKAVRHALTFATDKQQIIDRIFSGNSRLIEGPILADQVNGLTNATHQTNTEAAKQTLEKAGWTIDPQTNIRTKSGTKLEFTLATNDFPLNAQTAELLAEQWQNTLNVKVNLNILPTKELTENVIRPRKFDMLLFSQKLGADPDPFVFWHSSQIKNPGLNLPGFTNAAADKLISEARSSTDKVVRDDKYRQFENLIVTEAPAIFLNQSTYIYALNRNLKGVTLQSLADQSHRFLDANHWYLDERRSWK